MDRMQSIKEIESIEVNLRVFALDGIIIIRSFQLC